MNNRFRAKILPLTIAGLLAAAPLYAQDKQAQDKPAASDQAPDQRSTVSSTSNTTEETATRRAKQLETVKVTGQSLSIVGGQMSIQTAPKSISTVSRESIQQAAGGSNFTQLIDAIPGVDAATDDVSGLSNGSYNIRGYDSSSIGITVNGAPVSDVGSYSIYATEYGDGDNYNDITVIQGTPNPDQPLMGSTGGVISWSTIDPTHKAGLDVNQGFGKNDYRRTFLRLNTGDLGPVRSWVSWSKNSADKWRGNGDLNVTKVDGKLIWDINDRNSISASAQYSRQTNYSYANRTKAAIQKDYDSDYNLTWLGSNRAGNSGDSNYWGLRTNPYSNILVSLDGEFTLTDNLRLSVVPYYWHGDGGSGSGSTFFHETTNTSRNQYDYAHQDLNGDGVISNDGTRISRTAYAYSQSRTSRPGVNVKFIQDIGLNHNLSYGVWWEDSRKNSTQRYSTVDQNTGVPADFWSRSSFIYYPDGSPQQGYNSTTETQVQKYFVQENWTPSDQWQVTAGASYLWAKRDGTNFQTPGANYSTSRSADGSHSTFLAGGGAFNQTFHKWLPTAGVKFSPDDHNQIYYSFGKTFRLTPINSITLNEYGNVPIAPPETAFTHELGWRYYADRLNVAAAVYQSNYRNKQLTSYSEQLNTNVYSSIPKVRMRGLNLEAGYELTSQLNLYGSYTYTQAKAQTNFDGGDNGVYPIDGKQLANTPKNIGTLSLSYQVGDFWASLKAKYSGARYGDFLNTEKVGGFTTLSLNSGYNFQNLGWLEKPYIKLNVSNLLDHRAINYVSGLQPLATSGASEYASYTRPGVNGGPRRALSSAAPQYGVLQSRAFTVTFGASFF